MMIALDTRRFGFAVMVAHRDASRRMDVHLSILVYVGRGRWFLARQTSDLDRHMGSAIDRLDLRTEWCKQVAAQDEVTRQRWAQMERDVQRVFGGR